MQLTQNVHSLSNTSLKNLIITIFIQKTLFFHGNNAVPVARAEKQNKLRQDGACSSELAAQFKFEFVFAIYVLISI